MTTTPAPSLAPAPLAAADLRGPAPAGGGEAGPGNRIWARRGFERVVIPVERVAWLASDHRLTIVCERDGACHMVDDTLSALEGALDPRRFFRLNRKYLVHVDAVQGFRPAGRGRLSVRLAPAPDGEIVVRQERAAAFRAWLEGR